tara:strand:- start:203 stop:1498 length:1296 start_codon:yes stop_codon:yes gene_type:complete
MSYKPLLLVTAPVQTRSGYGAHARDIVRSLIDIDKFDIKIFPVRWGNTSWDALDKNDPNDKKILDLCLSQPNLDRQPDIHIHIVVPNEFQPIGKYNIGITAGIETTACPVDWIQGLNRMDMNIVPSVHAKDIFNSVVFDSFDKDKNKVGEIKSEKPIEVLFEGADTDIFKKLKVSDESIKSELSNIKENFSFLFVGHWLQGVDGQDRKDCYMMIKTFLTAFKDTKNPPALVLKTSGALPSVLDREAIFKKIREIRHTVSFKKTLPNIYLLHGTLTDIQMNELYNHHKIKSLISFTHGEGFGRPLLEFTMAEKPVIATGWSGHVDFLNKNLSILLPVEMTDVHKDSFPENIYVDGAQWATINYTQAAKVLKDVRSNFKNYSFKGKKQGKINKSQFSLNAMTKEFEKILTKHLPKFEEQPQQMDLKLPKLKKG